MSIIVDSNTNATPLDDQEQQVQVVSVGNGDLRGKLVGELSTASGNHLLTVCFFGHTLLLRTHECAQPKPIQMFEAISAAFGHNVNNNSNPTHVVPVT